MIPVSFPWYRLIREIWPLKRRNCISIRNTSILNPIPGGLPYHLCKTLTYTFVTVLHITIGYLVVMLIVSNSFIQFGCLELSVERNPLHSLIYRLWDFAISSKTSHRLVQKTSSIECQS